MPTGLQFAGSGRLLLHRVHCQTVAVLVKPVLAALCSRYIPVSRITQLVHVDNCWPVIFVLHAGVDSHDATSSRQPVPDFTAALQPAEAMSSHPLQGKRLGLITQTTGEGVSEGVMDAVHKACKQLEALGATVEEVHAWP